MPELVELTNQARGVINDLGPRCAGKTEKFFDPPWPPALRLCAECPAIEVCRWKTMAMEHRLTWHDRFGIAGGLTSRDRAQMGRGLTIAEVTSRLRKAIMRARCAAAPNVAVGRPVHSSRGIERDRQIRLARRLVGELASQLGVTKHGLLTKRGVPDVRRRWVAMAVARAHGYSFPVIGAAFSKDHITVMNGCERVASDPELSSLARDLFEVSTSLAS